MMMRHSKMLIVTMVFVLLAGCGGPTPAPPTPSPTTPPRPTIPILPTSTPSAKAPPATKGLFPVDLLAADRVPIKGDYYRPLAEQAPGVVLVHGTHRTRSDWQLLAWRMMEQGFATLAIDLRGAGESGGQPDDPNRLADVDAAVDFLKAQAEVNPNDILLVGENDGSWWALKYTSEHPNIRAAALITPGIRADDALLQPIMADYGHRPLFIAVSDNPAIGDDNAVRTGKGAAIGCAEQKG
ncbi:MAG TPA: alpha/beta fold hydrolase [Anaerolineae bacterium]|nr:alpha/beta fold hydrolase [Anaerolineae bacterium]